MGSTAENCNIFPGPNAKILMEDGVIAGIDLFKAADEIIEMLSCWTRNMTTRRWMF